jgi:hypothetical protein
MNWYYADGANQVGPLDDAAFDQLIQNGTIKPETLVWHEGMANWQALSEARPDAPPRLRLRPEAGQAEAAPAAGALATCSECGNEFPPDDMIRHGNAYVCANCKPVFLQKLKEGVATGVSVDDAALAEGKFDRDYSVELGSCFSRSWETVKGTYWPVIGATATVILAIGLMDRIPFIGPIASLILQGPLMGGLYMFYIKLVRGDEAQFGDAFGGFGPRFLQLMLVHIVTGVLAGLCFVPAILCAIPLFIKLFTNPNPDDLSQAIEALGGLLIPFIALLAALYLTVCWIFSLLLVVDKRLSFWTAMMVSMKAVNKHWFAVFGFLFVGGLMCLVSFLLCCVPFFLLGGPVFLGAITFLYDDIFGTGAGATA